MKKILLFLLVVAAALPCRAVNDYRAQGAGSSIGDTDVILFETTGGTLYKISASTVKTYAQTGAVLTGGTYSDPSWLTGVDWSIVGGRPTTLAGYGISDPLLVLTSGSYANPSWITSLAASKITGLITYSTASGTNVYTASPSPALTSYTAGLSAYILFTNANTGGASLNLNSLGAVPIQQNGAAVAAGQIVAGSTLHLIYDGTNFQIIGNDSGGYTWSTGLSNSAGTISVAYGTSAGTALQGNSIGSSVEAHSSTLDAVAGGTYTGAASIATLGTVTVGTWHGSIIAPAYLGTGTANATTFLNGSGAYSVPFTLTTTGSGAATFSGGTLNIPTGGGGGSTTWTSVHANTTLTAGEHVWVDLADFTPGSFTLTLPASPSDGEAVVVGDLLGYSGGGFASYPQTVSTTDGILDSTTLTAVTSVSMHADHEHEVFVYSSAVGCWLGTISVLDPDLIHPAGTPAIAAGGAAGSSPTVTVTGSDFSGTISVTTGTSPAPSIVVATVSYHTAFATAPNAEIWPVNDAAAALFSTANVYVSSNAAGTFTIAVGSSALTASSGPYQWGYAVHTR